MCKIRALNVWEVWRIKSGFGGRVLSTVNIPVFYKPASIQFVAAMPTIIAMNIAETKTANNGSIRTKKARVPLIM